MNWYKDSQTLTNLSDRNRLNERIRDFEELADVLDYLTKYVYQNAPHAKESAEKIAADKRISSYPEIRDLLLNAAGIALDSYNKFANYCKDAVEKLTRIVEKMIKEREEFTNEKFPEQIRQRRRNG